MPIPLRGPSRAQVEIFFALQLVARYDYMKSRNRQDFLRARKGQYEQAVKFLQDSEFDDVFALFSIPTVSRSEIKQAVKALKIVGAKKDILQELETFAKTRK